MYHLYIDVYVFIIIICIYIYIRRSIYCPCIEPFHSLDTHNVLSKNFKLEAITMDRYSCVLTDIIWKDDAVKQYTV